MSLSSSSSRSRSSSSSSASCWLTAIPLEQHGFTLHKSAFRDALCLRYGWHPSNLPDICPCGSKFSVDHSLSCPTGGYPSIRHNEVRDLFTNLLTEVCHDVHKEPVLQPLNGEVFQKRCTTSDENARLDIAVSGFWGGHFQRTFFDVRVFNPNASSYKSVQIPSLYKRQEQEKKRRYEERINNVELSSFTPIILACTGGCSKLTSIFLKRRLRITSLVCFWFHHDPQRFYSVGDRKSLSTVNRDLNFKSLLFCSASSLSTP
ncbi:uncharacterized protein LOC134184780 [Corticium candelabrum]|uniref:uncharacterized protein LOC134184780 n=1 Tax=Corticium candelabrum TaxID=121492 RepID=UPI002E3713FC|nr:uncharacterized protein LOC134184780 [Corticium candelabrum]